MMPQMTSEEEGPLVDSQLLEHLLKYKTLQATHYVGSKITIKSLFTCKMNCKKLGLQTSVQEGYS
jgi:hypothetical protein